MRLTVWFIAVYAANAQHGAIPLFQDGHRAAPERPANEAAADKERTLEAALRLAQRSGGSAPGLARALNHLAEFYLEKGRCAEAWRLYQRSLPLMEQALGPEHPEVAVTLANSCAAAVGASHHLNARPLCERALRVRRRILPPDHPDIASSLSDLGSVYAQEGNFADAERLLRRAVAIMRLSPGAAYAAVPLNNLADLYARKRRFGLAAETFALSVTCTERNYGQDHPGLVRILINLGHAHLLDDNFQAAEPVFSRALRVLENSADPENTDKVWPLLGLARVAAARHDKFEAETFLRRAQDLVALAPPPDSGLTDALAMIAGVVSRMKSKAGPQ
jgi:tetratricopeptide (TPR) repeat protein